MTIEQMRNKFLKWKGKFNSRYLLEFNDIVELYESNASRAELITSCTLYGYMQGAKATEKEFKKRVVQK